MTQCNQWIHKWIAEVRGQFEGGELAGVPLRGRAVVIGAEGVSALPGFHP
jgi:hypothetical protein